MTLRRTLVAALLSVTMASTGLRAAPPADLDDAQFHQLHTLIKPQPGESRWMEIDWYPSVWEGLKRAAAEGKPLFLMAGSGGAPAAGC